MADSLVSNNARVIDSDLATTATAVCCNRNRTIHRFTTVRASSHVHLVPNTERKNDDEHRANRCFGRERGEKR